MAINEKTSRGPLIAAFHVCKSNFVFVVIFSFFINILMFVSPLYMLQVYDRVLSSRSVVTLVMVTLLAVSLLIVYAALEIVRSRILVRTGAKFDREIGSDVFRTSFRGHVRAPGGGYSQPIRDLDTTREFLTGGGLIVFCDAPWAPVFLAICFMIHFWIGVIATCGAIIIFSLALANEFATRSSLKDASAASIGANQYVSTTLRNAEIIHALGMMGAINHRWSKLHDNALSFQAKASDRSGSILALSKFVRVTLQIAILGVGSYLVLQAEVTAGAMIASSILMGRALAPVEGAVAQWKGFKAARYAYGRLNKMFELTPAENEHMPLPAPTGAVNIEQLVIGPPGKNIATLKSVNMQITAGEIVGVIGPSGSGKSTFARALTGVWPSISGHIRFDGADIQHWHPEALGPHLGYLPQDVELFSGTVAENIARFSKVDADAVVAAAQKAGVHDMIQQLPNGYDTKLGDAGQSLSGGQRQRIGLARAFYGNPKIIILDEPNSSLDSQGEAALAQALRTARNEKRTVIVISHRASLMNEVDKLAVFTNGTLTMYGPTRIILDRLNGTAGSNQAPKAVPEARGQVASLHR